jgi:hypothetical protein
MYRANTLVSAYILESTHHGKDVARMLIEQSPTFHLKIKDGCLWKADPVLLDLPASIRTVDEANDWLLANHSENCAEVACRKDMIAARATHALGDGGHWVIAYNSLERRPERPLRQWIYTLDELFGQYFSSFTAPCSLDLSQNAYQMRPSYSPRKTAEVVDVTFPLAHDTLPCYDRKLRKPVALTEHSWASMLVAAALHDWEMTGIINLEKTGIMTLVNMRPWVDKAMDVRCVGNCYSRVLPGAGAAHCDETLGAITERMRTAMTRQLKDLEHLKVLKKPLAAPTGAPLILSNPGPVHMPQWIVTGAVKEIVEHLDPTDTAEWPFMVTYSNLKYGNRKDNQCVMTHANKVVLSAQAIEQLQKRTIKGLLTLTLDMTLRQALAKIEPRVKSAL